MYLVIMNLVQIWKLKLKMKYLVHILLLMAILLVLVLNCLLQLARAVVPPLVPKSLGHTVLVSIRLVAPTPRLLARVCVKPLRTGVCCPNSANEDGAAHNYHGSRDLDNRAGVVQWL